MTLETVLFILLGFLLAVFLTLLVIPVIWNRAVVLTEQKVKASLPLTPDDIEAEKDKLRAEHAMTVRRMELGMEDLRRKASASLAHLHGQRDEHNQLRTKSKTDDEKIRMLEKAGEDVREKLASSYSTVEGLTQKLEQIETEHAELLEKNAVAQEEIDRARIELVARSAQVESLDGTLATVQLPEEAQAVRIAELNGELSELKVKLDKETKRAETAEGQLEQLKQKMGSGGRIGRSSKKGNGLQFGELESQISSLNSDLLEKRTRIIQLEAELARQSENTEQKSSNPYATTSPLEDLREESETLAEEIATFGAAKRKTGKRALRNKIKALGQKTVEQSKKGGANVSQKGKLSDLGASPKTADNPDTLLERIREIQNELKSGM